MRVPGRPGGPIEPLPPDRRRRPDGRNGEAGDGVRNGNGNGGNGGAGDGRRPGDEPHRERDARREAPITVAAERTDRPRLLRRDWIAVLGVALVVGSEYSFRSRDQGSSLSGQADAAILIEVAVYGAVAMFLAFQVMEPPRHRRIPVVLMAMWAFTAAMVLAATWSPYHLLALVRALQLVIVAAFAHMVARHGTSTTLHRFAHAYVALVGASVALGVAVPISRGASTAGRFSWLYVHPNIAGVFLAIVVIVLVSYLVLARRNDPVLLWPTWWYRAGLVIVVGALLATRSRGAMAGAVAGVIAIGYATSRRRGRLDLLLVVGATLCLTWLLASGDIVTFLERGDSAEQLGSLNSRTEVWEQGWQLYDESPLFGQGFMTARGAFLETFGLGGAHNAFFEVLVNSGLFGTFWWLLLLGLVAAGAARLVSLRDRDGPLVMGVFLCLVASSLTAGGLGQAGTVQNVWLFLLVGWIVAAPRLVPPAPGTFKNRMGGW